MYRRLWVWASVALLIGGIAAACAVALAQTPSSGTITVDAALTYAHDDADNNLLAAFETSVACGRHFPRETFVGWKRTFGWDGVNGAWWNGLSVDARLSSERTSTGQALYDLRIVGSAIESGVSKDIIFDSYCNEPPRLKAHGRGVKLTVTVTGDVPGHIAPETQYHGMRFTPGPHPDNVHDDDLAPALAPLEKDIAALQCRANDSALWSDTLTTTREWTTPSWLDIDAEYRAHCCIKRSTDVTFEDCAKESVSTGEESEDTE